MHGAPASSQQLYTAVNSCYSANSLQLERTPTVSSPSAADGSDTATASAVIVHARSHASAGLPGKRWKAATISVCTKTAVDCLNNVVRLVQAIAQEAQVLDEAALEGHGKEPGSADAASSTGRGVRLFDIPVLLVCCASAAAATCEALYLDALLLALWAE